MGGGYVNNEILLDLLDEGYINDELTISQYMNNRSLIGDDIYRLLDERVHHRCSVNQSGLRGWTWLVGSPGGTLDPLLCLARRRDTCDPGFDPPQLSTIHGFGIAFNIFFALANLVTLAVWCRVKPPLSGVNREVPIQLMLVRLSCLLGLVWSVAFASGVWWGLRSNIRVLSVPHAAFVANFKNAVSAMHPFCTKIFLFLYFLTSIYLVEYSHAAQSVRLFVSTRWAQVMVGTAVIIALALSIMPFVSMGYVYCTHDGASYLLRYSYMRLPFQGLIFYAYLFQVVGFLLMLVALILLAVYACKQCCACCRGLPGSSGGAADSVTYSRQLDESDSAATEEQGEEGPVVVIDVDAASIFPVNKLADELRRVIAWHQAVFVLLIVGVIIVMIVFAFVSSNNLRNVFFILLILSTQLLVFSRLMWMSPIVSPTFRTGFLALVVEVRAFVVESACWQRIFSHRPDFSTTTGDVSLLSRADD